MGIERGDREARLGDPEILLQTTQCRPPARLDQCCRKGGGDLGERDMGRHQHRAQGWPGKHHRDIAGRDTAAFGDEFGLAGVGEADRVQLFLADRAGHYRACRPRPGEAHGEFERVERHVRPRQARAPRDGGLKPRNGDQRQADVERAIGLARVVDGRDRPVPHRSDRPRIAHRDERGDPERGAVVPAFGDDLGPDPRRIPERHRQWHIRVARQCPSGSR